MEGQIPGIWDPHRDPEQGTLSPFPILPLGQHGTSFPLDSLGCQEAGVAEALLSIISVDTLVKIWIKRNQSDIDVLEQGL